MALSIAQSLVNPRVGYFRPKDEVHTEYPKFVHFTDGRPSVIVQDAEEEKAVLAGELHTPKEPKTAAPPANILVGQNNELAMLRKIAAEKGIHIDGRWKIAKIRKAIEAASK